MSNRILAFLVLFWVIAGFVLLYIYFFVYYTATITIRSNVPWYSVELFWKSVAQTFTYDCPEEVCVVADISPIEYNMTLKKDWYLDFFQNIDIAPSSREELIVTLEKEVSLERVEDPVVEVSSGSGEIVSENSGATAQDKISQILKDKTYFKLYPLLSGNEIGFKEKEFEIEGFSINQDGIETLFNSFPKTSRTIRLEEIIETPYIYLEVSDRKYLYNTDRETISQLDLVPEVLYVKQGRVSTELLFITDKWAFVYNIGAKSFTYFYFFLDFVYLDDSYIGIIYKDEEQKRRNYWLTDEEKNVIIRYNPNTQERDVLYRTDLKIDKIFQENSEIFFEAEGEKYKLDNY